MQTIDGGYIVSGLNSRFGVGDWLIKFDKNGNENWNRTYGGKMKPDAYVKQTSDGGFLLMGSTADVTGSGDILLFKTDEIGNEKWNISFSRNENLIAKSFQRTSDGGYILAGYTELNYKTEALLIKVGGKDTDIDINQSKSKPLDIEKPIEKSVSGFGILGAAFAVSLIYFSRRPNITKNLVVL